MFKFNFLSGNFLKIIALITMLIDHVGLMFFPNVVLFRIIGRIAFPIFAFFIAEGCNYTRNKFKYFITILTFGIIGQAIFLIFEGSWVLNILLTFSLSIALIYLLQWVKYTFYNKKSNLIKITSCVVFGLLIVFVYIINKLFDFDYGFWGCMLPLLISTVNYRGENCVLKSMDNKFIKLILLSIGLIIISISFKSVIQLFSLFSVIFLMFYSHKRGNLKMKYFFYGFYVGHLLILYLTKMIICVI